MALIPFGEDLAVNMYKRWLRPLLFRLDAETAHNMAKAILQRPYLGQVLGGEAMFVRDERLQVTLGGLRISNPVGLAAGFDKDCDMVNSLQRFGFGYIVAGSVMCSPRPGNPRPRMVRDPAREALYSCMGLPSKGLNYVSKHLEQRRHGYVPLIINFNAMDLREYLTCMEALQPLGDALEITLFCPNRPDDAGDFLNPRFAETLFVEIAKRKKKPLFVKIPGYVSEDDRQNRLDLIDRILKYPVDGITITPESRVKENRLSVGYGTLTGRPLFQQTLKVIRDVYELTRDQCDIKATGGVFTAEDAFEAIAAGATSVEILTGFLYEGWSIAKSINRGLVNLMHKCNIENVQALRGARM